MLVLDEPTANLPATEIARMFDVVRAVRDRGVAVLFVSHHLDEVFSLCDTVTVLRDGRHVVTRPVEGLDEEALIGLMIGRTLEQHEVSRRGRRAPGRGGAARPGPAAPACWPASTSTCRPAR